MRYAAAATATATATATAIAAIAPLHAEDLVSVEQALAAAFPRSGAVERLTPAPTPAQRAAVLARAPVRAAARLSGVWVAHSGGVVDGIAFLDQVVGRTEYITWMCVLGADGRVRQARVLSYREPYGGEVRDERFLAQFRGKGPGDALRVGHEIAGIAGATLSVMALAERLAFILAYHDLVLQQAIAAWLPGRPSPAGGADPRLSERVGVLGNSALAVRIRHDGGPADRAAAEAVADLALAAAASSDGALNSWREDTELARLNAAGGGALSALMRRGLDQARALHLATGGLVDPTVAPLLRAWQAAVRADRVPAAAELAAARAAIGLARVGWERELALPAGMALDLSAFRKGAALDEAAVAARSALRGGMAMLLDAGGSSHLAAGSGAPFLIDLRDPVDPARVLQRIALAPGRALAASSSDGLVFAVAGRRVSHLIDPRTGEPAPPGRAAFVLADSAALADALATACCLADPDEGLRLARAAGAETLILRDGVRRASPGWPAAP